MDDARRIETNLSINSPLSAPSLKKLAACFEAHALPAIIPFSAYDFAFFAKEYNLATYKPLPCQTILLCSLRWLLRIPQQDFQTKIMNRID
jgi:hypothetical protein